ncbi:hypothetical Protein YC6258_03358 [Gynuella sunshinyii YC6258]|uniref:Uncharacterized protein n=1 Tax=Gynuella sunshinyii YC6258 TaxID=1445510 RepID=A0A0C5VYC9_9GAMM|nr:hypothetical Protein YC6258_03358 [Gynuella sunshinyii YC6258]
MGLLMPVWEHQLEAPDIHLVVDPQVSIRQRLYVSGAK